MTQQGCRAVANQSAVISLSVVEKLVAMVAGKLQTKSVMDRLRRGRKLCATGA